MAVTAFIAPGSGVNEALAGSSKSWTNPNNIRVADGSNADATTYALAGTLGNGQYSDSLVANFDFSGQGIPAGSTFTGIEVSVIRDATTASKVLDNHIAVRKGTGGTLSIDKASATNWPTTFTSASYGNTASDMWGLTLTVSDLSTLQVLVSCKSTGLAVSGRVDQVTARIGYTPPPGSSFSIAGTGAVSAGGASTAKASFSSQGAGTESATGKATFSASTSASGLGTINGVGAALSTQGAIAVPGQGAFSPKGRANFLGTVSIAGLTSVAAVGSPASAFHLGTAALSGIGTIAFVDGSFEIWVPQTYTPEGGAFVTFSDGAFFSDGSSFGQDEVLIWNRQQTVSDVWTEQVPSPSVWASVG